MTSLPEALQPLAAYRQFIIHTQADKVPRHHQTGKPCDPHDPANQLDADTALAIADASTGYGVGFVFTERDPFFFLDIDGALQPDNTWSPLAVELCETLRGAAVEISQSGKGLHIIGSGPTPPHGCKNVPLGIELYTEGRYVALTGTGASGSVLHHPPALSQVISAHFPPSEAVTDAPHLDGPCEGYTGPTDDSELIKRMLASRSAGSVFGGRASVQDLWSANIEVLAVAYPDTSGDRGYDASSADAALCQHLAFWTGKDAGRIDRLFQQSGLNRDKWMDREDYRSRTISHAIGHCKDVYGSRGASQTVEDIEYRTGFQFLSLDQVVKYFKGCVYVRDIHKIFTPDGSLLKTEQFKSYYSGYVFALDALNDKTTKNPWEAFIDSQGITFPRAHSTCFRPELPAGTLVQEEGHTLVNTYVPAHIERIKGDPAPFLGLLKLMLPDESDRATLLSYMAACVQYPGVKFQWTPLIQGCEGNGKTFLMKCMTHAIGKRYTHLPNAQDMGGNGSKFNAWLWRKLFIGVEEIYVSDRREVLDALKPLITNDRIEIQGKGQDQITGDNRANFIMCSNHKDAIIKTKNDRRFCVFYTAHQTQEDLIRDGMKDTKYFTQLWGWARTGGYSIVAEYLASYPIPDALNPATSCHRAPVTSSTSEALAVSLGGVEQEIMEAIDEGKPGFGFPWISSMAFNRLLMERRDSKRIPPRKRGDILHALGYVLHPELKNGRATKFIPLDSGQPRLYIKEGHLAASIQDTTEIIRLYLEAQGVEDSPSLPKGASKFPQV